MGAWCLPGSAGWAGWGRALRPGLAERDWEIQERWHRGGGTGSGGGRPFSWGFRLRGPGPVMLRPHPHSWVPAGSSGNGVHWAWSPSDPSSCGVTWYTCQSSSRTGRGTERGDKGGVWHRVGLDPGQGEPWPGCGQLCLYETLRAALLLGRLLCPGRGLMMTLAQGPPRCPSPGSS